MREPAKDPRMPNPPPKATETKVGEERVSVKPAPPPQIMFDHPGRHTAASANVAPGDGTRATAVTTADQPSTPSHAPGAAPEGTTIPAPGGALEAHLPVVVPAGPAAAAPTESLPPSVTPVHVASTAPAAAPVRAPPPANLVPISRDAPEFPREAIAQGIERGSVKVRLTVDAQGKVSQIDILDASHRAFDRAVRNALARWQFEPGAGGRTTTVDVAFKRD
jgi:protein TonB